MTRRRPATTPCHPTAQRQPVTARDPAEGPIAIWYAALIGAVLLIATAIYAFFLYQQVEEWRSAAGQLTIGQELLQADRDEILQRARDQEVTISTLEAAREQDQMRLETLEAQRQRLQGSVLKLTQDLARTEQQSNGAADDLGSSDIVERLQRERDRLDRDLNARGADIGRLETTLAEKNDELTRQEEDIARLKSEMLDIEARALTLEQDRDRLGQQITEWQIKAQRRQIVRGHRASLGEVKPYIAEVGPEDWSVIEDWLALQLGRPMAVPDLAAHGWSYEGARLLGLDEGPPMAMLLYADQEDRPVSLTVARDNAGERPLETFEDGGLTLLGWREERHAFFLAGELGEDPLRAVAIDLQNEPPRMREDAVVPLSRYLRPSFRPSTSP